MLPYKHWLFVCQSTQTLTPPFLACDIMLDILVIVCISETTFLGESDTLKYLRGFGVVTYSFLGVVGVGVVVVLCVYML